jgi:hypothetical protein
LVIWTPCHGRVGLPSQQQELTNLATVDGGNAAAVPGSDERSRRAVQLPLELLDELRETAQRFAPAVKFGDE